MVPAPRRAPGAARRVPAHAAHRGRARAARRAAGRARSRTRSRPSSVLVAAVAWPRYVDGVSNLAHKIVDLTDARRSRCSSRWTSASSASRAAARRSSTPPQLACCARRRRAPPGGLGDLPRSRSTTREQRAARAVLAGAAREPLRGRDRSCRAGPVRSAPDETVAARDGRSASATARAESSCVDGRPARRRRRPRGSRPRRSRHGLSHAPVKGIMSGRVPTCDETTPLGELQRLLTASADGRVAVLRDGRSSASSRAATSCARSASRPRSKARPSRSC